MTKQDIKDKLNTFVQPFKPLGQAIIVFAKTSTGKTVGVLVLIIIVTGGILSQNENHKHKDHDIFGPHRAFMMIDSDERFFSDTQTRHEKKMKEFARDLDRIDKQIARHRQDILEAMRMDRPSSINPQTTHQTISKLRIDNNKQSGYSLTISGGIIQGELTGENIPTIIKTLQSIKATASGSMFSIPYTIDNLQKVIEILDEK